MKREELEKMLQTPKSLNEFIADIDVKTNKDKEIVCSLYALSMKINQLDNALSALLSNIDIEANVPKLTEELTDMTQALETSNGTLVDLVNKILEQSKK